MATVGNNVNPKYSHTRDSFFSKSEQKYYKKLMEDPKERKIHAGLLHQKAESLHTRAINLINRVEAGEFNEEQMVKVEHMIAHYLAAIEDLERVLELELTHNFGK